MARAKSYLTVKKDQEVRAGMMMAQKLLGKSKAEIAALFSVSTDTVNRGLELARKKDLYGIAERVVIERLLPRALATFEEAIDLGDVEAARDILYGTGVLQKKQSLNVGEGEITIDAIRAKIFATKRKPTEIGSGTLEPDIEVTVSPIEEGSKTDGERFDEGVVAEEGR